MNGARPPAYSPYWLIVKYGDNSMSVFTIGLADEEEALPVFSFEEEARTFLRSRTLESEWEIRETGSGELLSILLGLCANARRVVLDPAAETGAETLADLVSLGRETFMGHLLNGKRLTDTQNGRL